METYDNRVAWKPSIRWWSLRSSIELHHDDADTKNHILLNAHERVNGPELEASAQHTSEKARRRLERSTA